MPSADKNPTIPQQVLDLVDRFDRNRDAVQLEPQLQGLLGRNE
jgi:hypothetical protein